MGAPSRRRNRSLASCEPCRRRKTRCDHGRPICECCQRRHLRCWYDPAPLTKASNPQSQTQAGYSPNARESDYHSLSPPTCIFTWPYMSADSSDPPLQGQTTNPGIYNSRSYDEHLRSIEGILSQLKLFPVIEKRLHSYYRSSQVPLVPLPLTLQLLDAVRSCATVSNYLRRLNADPKATSNGSQLAKNILASSSSDIVMTPHLNLSAFCALFTGKNLRIETIGLLLTMTARSSLYSMRNGDSQSDDLEFIREMGYHGNSCLRLARELSPQTTDVMIWLAHENLQLATHFDGDASLAVWRRVGDIATDILAMGLNRESTYSATPVFLEQCRRRTFAKAYYLDQLYAAVFHRPPRITARHADCSLPLDLSDEDIFGSPAQLEEAKGRLTKHGWNIDENYRTATWVRIRYILAQYREEITEYQFRRLLQADKVKLRDLSSRCHQMWNGLPIHLQYSNDCWTSDLPPEHCYMHVKVYLSYLHIHFQAYQALSHLEGHASFLPELLDVSMTMLETVVHMTTRRSRSFSPLDLPGIVCTLVPHLDVFINKSQVLTCGLPCSAILSTALMDSLKGASSLPPVANVPSIIRNLSVLVSQLETIANPSEANYAFCIKASKAISNNLDQILEKSISVNSRQTSDVSPKPHSEDTLADLNVSFGMEDVDVNLDDFNLADWFNFDASAIFDE